MDRRVGAFGLNIKLLGGSVSKLGGPAAGLKKARTFDFGGAVGEDRIGAGLCFGFTGRKHKGDNIQLCRSLAGLPGEQAHSFAIWMNNNGNANIFANADRKGLLFHISNGEANCVVARFGKHKAAGFARLNTGCNLLAADKPCGRQARKVKQPHASAVLISNPGHGLIGAGLVRIGASYGSGEQEDGGGGFPHHMGSSGAAFAALALLGA